MTRSTALITGASRGIGAATAVALGRDGISLVGLHYGHDRAAAEATAERVRALGAAVVLSRPISPRSRPPPPRSRRSGRTR